MSDIPLKRCTKCGEEFPATPEFFHRMKQSKDGLRPNCKVCMRKNVLEGQRRPEMHARRLAYMKTYNSRPEVRARNIAWHKRPEVREYQRIYEHRPEIKERTRIRQKDYRSLPEVQAYIRSRYKIYRKRPEVRQRSRVHARTRDARKKTIQGTHTAQHIQDLLKRQRYKCYYCRDKFEKRKGRYVYHVDHTFPVSRVAGTDIPANDISYLVLACPTCNQRKQDKYPWEWPEGGRLL